MSSPLRQLSRSTAVLVGGGIVALLVLVAVFAPLLAPYDPVAIAGDSFLSPSAQHLLGTNAVGQDIFSELIYGTRISLIVGVGAAGLTVVVGTIVGAGAGLMGGAVEQVAMRLADLFMALPVFPLLIVIGALAGAGQTQIILALGLLAWPGTARVLRSQTLSLRQRGFVGAAQGFGGGRLYVIRRHLVPALGPILVADFVNWASNAIFLEAALALFGLGNPLEVSWGAIFNAAFSHTGVFFSSLWTWWLLPPVMAITVTILGFVLLGVGLEPIFNPRSRVFVEKAKTVTGPARAERAEGI
ncbi:MAG: ABC transporter permease [Actinomycetota bacterium]|nr:ABC transporter permease [Actinomycetota bacterium]